jgi:hypothetical protein
MVRLTCALVETLTLADVFLVKPSASVSVAVSDSVPLD